MFSHNQSKIVSEAWTPSTSGYLSGCILYMNVMYLLGIFKIIFLSPNSKYKRKESFVKLSVYFGYTGLRKPLSFIFPNFPTNPNGK